MAATNPKLKFRDAPATEVEEEEEEEDEGIEGTRPYTASSSLQDNRGAIGDGKGRRRRNRPQHRGETASDEEEEEKEGEKAGSAAEGDEQRSSRKKHRSPLVVPSMSENGGVSHGIDDGEEEEEGEEEQVSAVASEEMDDMENEDGEGGDKGGASGSGAALSNVASAAAMMIPASGKGKSAADGGHASKRGHNRGSEAGDLYPFQNVINAFETHLETKPHPLAAKTRQMYRWMTGSVCRRIERAHPELRADDAAFRQWVVANAEIIMTDYVEWESQGFRHFLEYLGVPKNDISAGRRRKSGGGRKPSSEGGGKERRRRDDSAVLFSAIPSPAPKRARMGKGVDDPGGAGVVAAIGGGGSGGAALHPSHAMLPIPEPKAPLLTVTPEQLPALAVPESGANAAYPPPCLMDAFRQYLKEEKGLVKGIDGSVGVVETFLVELMGQEAVPRLDAAHLATIINNQAERVESYLREQCSELSALNLAWKRFAVFIGKTHELRVTIDGPTRKRHYPTAGAGAYPAAPPLSLPSPSAEEGEGGGGLWGEATGADFARTTVPTIMTADGAGAAADGDLLERHQAETLAALRDEVLALRRERQELVGRCQLQERVLWKLEQRLAEYSGAVADLRQREKKTAQENSELRRGLEGLDGNSGGGMSSSAGIMMTTTTIMKDPHSHADAVAAASSSSSIPAISMVVEEGSSSPAVGESGLLLESHPADPFLGAHPPPPPPGHHPLGLNGHHDEAAGGGGAVAL